MKLILKILKWIGITLASLLILILLSGLCYRLFGPDPAPPGSLLDVNGTELHIRADGAKNNLPTLVIEGGAGCHTDLYHWLAEGLKNRMRVVRYDREGLGYSELSKDTLTPKTYAHQLHTLLESYGEEPPYIFAGHSIGGPYIRIFTDLYPKEVEGLIFLDSSHPDQRQRFEDIGMLQSKDGTGLLKFFSILADMGILGLVDQIFGPHLAVESLPKVTKDRSHDLLFTGKYIRGALKESDYLNSILNRARQTNSFNSLPILVFTAAEEIPEGIKEGLRGQGVDPNEFRKLWFEMQQEIKNLSSRGKQFDINGDHSSIFTKKENAEMIVQEILLMVEGLEPNK